jgi:uncharacterized protein (TIRG00374 family)
MFIAALGVLTYIGIAFAVGSARLTSAVVRLGWQGVLAVLALSVSSYLLRFQRWQMYLRRFGHHLPAFRHLLVYVSGFAFTLSPGKAGEALRSMYLRDHGVLYAESLAAFFVERMLDVLAMVILAAFIVVDHAAYQKLVIGALLVVLLLIIGVSRPGLPKILDVYAAGRTGRLVRVVAGLANLLKSSRSLLRWSALTWGITLGTLAWAALGLGLCAILRGLHATIAPPVAIGIYAMAVLAGNAAIFLPGGIGGTEIVMVALLRESGVPMQSAILAALLCSLATLWFAVLIGIAAGWVIEFAPLNGSASTVKSIPRT